MVTNDGYIDGLQIRIISDAISVDASVYVEPPSVMFIDYFVFVIDDFAKVYMKQIRSHKIFG